MCVIIFDGMGRDIWFSCWSDHEKTIFGAIEEAIYLLNRNDLSKSKWAGGRFAKVWAGSFAG